MPASASSAMSEYMGDSLSNLGSTPAATPVDPFIESTQNSINILKAELGTMTATALRFPEGEERLKLLEACKVKGDLLRVLLATIVDADKVASLGSSSGPRTVKQSNVVPPNLPLFQWEGHCFNSKAPIFVDVTACLQKFEDVMFSHNLDYDTNFKRLVPACLSTSQRTWYEQYLASLGETRLTSVTWVMFKLAITDHYGLTVDEDRSSAAVALIDIEMAKNESIDSFIDRFNNLRRRAVDQCPPASVLINKFLGALPANLHDKVTVSKATLEKSRKTNVEVIINLVKDLSKELSKNKSKRGFAEQDLSDNVGSKRSKWASSSSAAAGSPGTSTSRSGSSSSSGSSKKPSGTGSWCSFHKVNTHNTVNCRVVSSATAALNSASGPSSASSASSSQNTNSNKPSSCFKCGVSPWTPRHQCNTARRNAPGSDINSASQYLGAMHLNDGDSSSTTPLPNEVNNSTQSSADDITMEDVDSSVQAMVAQQSQLCTYNQYSQLPSHKSNSILIPVILENTKTFAVVDTGASFSIVSPDFVKSLGSSVVVFPSSGSIQLGHKQSHQQRTGHCFLDIFYNKIKFKFKFEIFDFFSDVKNVPLLFGLDILPKLNIGITGLVSSWFDYTGPALPSPINPEEIKPNESPFGSHSERQMMLSKLKPLLNCNAQIDLKNTYCNLPDSIVRLDTIPGKEAYRKQYPQPEAYRTAVLAQIDTWQKEGVIELAECHTGFNSPLLCVSKKDEHGVYTFKKPRVVADVRLLNSILLSTDKFQFPMISDIHQKIGPSPIISSIDIHSCFTSFLVLPEHRHKLAFTCPYTGSQWMFRKVCFGISFMGNFTQRVLSNLFRDLPYVSVYVDDIQIATRPPLSYHTECVAEVLRRLTKANLQISPEKLVLAQKSIHILGWSIVNGKLIPDPRKVSNVHTWPVPSTGKQLMSYLGFMNYFRNSIPLYAMLSAPLDSIRNYKSLDKVWTPQHTEAFNNLKLALASAPVISPPDFSCRLHVATDASLTGIGGIIYYIKNDTVHYVAMASRKLSSSEQNYSTTKRELLAVVFIFNKFHKWLFGIQFTLHTDHKSLIFLNHQSIPNMLMLNWYEVIFSYSFDVVHIPGCLNVIPDALSRLFSDDDESSLEGDKCNNIANKYKTKKYCKQKKVDNVSKAVTPRVTPNRFQKKNIHTVDSFNHLSFSSFPVALKKQSVTTNEYYNNNAYVRPPHSTPNAPLVNRALQLAEYMTPPNKERVPIIMKAHLLGHFGINAIEKTIHNDYNFHWTNMRQDIQKVINDCVACQAHGIYKVGYHPPRSVLPDGVFDHICMDLGDFNTTSSSGNNFILVVVDYFSRFTILRALPDKHSHTIAKELLSIFCLFGFPKIINSDQGSEFVNEIVTNLIEMSGIDRRLSLPYTPTSNPVAEKFVGTTKRTIIKTLTANGAAPTDWDLYLDPCQYAINAQYARLHKSRPFSVMYNRQPNGFQDYTNLRPSLSLEHSDSRAIDDKLKFVKETVIPALAKRINETQSNDHERFINTHKIVNEKYPINSRVMITNVNRTSKMTERWLGPYIITGYTAHGSYILNDLTGTPLPRHLPTQQIRLIQSGNKRNPGDFKNEHYEVQAIVNHRGTPGNYEYYVHWVGYDDQEKDNTWQSTNTFDSMKPIQEYWSRYNKATSGTSEHNLSSQFKRPRKIPTAKYYSRSKAQRSVPSTRSKAKHS